MAKHAAFLRGINVGGHKATKDQLCAAFERAGLGDVSTFRASGNVFFNDAGAKPDEAAIERALADELGYEAPVFLRSARQVAKVAAAKPFPAARLKASKGKLQVAFLPKRPAKGKADAALELASADDALAIGGTELYWLPKGGISETELDVRALEKLIGPWTMRTMGTVELISARLNT